MTTQSWSTAFDHSSDATFRAWGSELSTKFAAVGMVQTADTGQINWTTVTRPGTSTAGGYEIWRLSGSALYFKFEYGTGANTGSPAMWITVGTGSNGSGTLTGQLSTRSTAYSTTASAVSVPATARQSYLCATASFFGLSWKLGSTGTANDPWVLMCAGVTSDATGAPTAVGNYVITRALLTNTIASLQTVRQASVAATRSVTTSYCVFPGLPAASTDGTNNQAYLHWLDTPAVLPALYTASIIATELSLGNTATMTLFGATPHTYITVATSTQTRFDAAGTSGLALVMLWE